MAREFDFDAGSVQSGSRNTESGAGNVAGVDGATTASADNGGGNGTDENRASVGDGSSTERVVIKVRGSGKGRPRLPRDADGNIIRPEGYTGPNVSSKASKPSLGVKGFIPNDRVKVRGQIQGMHQVAAMLAKQPILMLSEIECDMLSKSVCDVLDYHKISLSAAAGPWGLYAALALTAFTIYKPRLDALAAGGGVQIEQDAQPATPGAASVRSGVIDLSGDIEEAAIRAAN
jgi:hypothetical protein